MMNTPYQSRGFANFKLSRSEAPTGHHPVEGIQRGHDPGDDDDDDDHQVMMIMTQGLKNLQESATYKRTAENLQFAKVLFHKFWEKLIFKLLNLKVWSIAQICRTLRERRVRGWSQAYRLLPHSRCFDLPLLLIRSIRSQILRWTLNEENIF